MDKHYCSVHGEYRTYSWETGGCPDCKEAVERSEQEHGELLETLVGVAKVSAASAEHAAYLANNPGDYECPSCKMISLKRNASRCPQCRADVPTGFWQDIREHERVAEEDRKRAEEKRRQWLASPEHAEELRLEAERKKLAIDADVARQEAELKTAKRRKRAKNNRIRILLLSGVAGNGVGTYVGGQTGSFVGIGMGLILGWYVGRRLCNTH